MTGNFEVDFLKICPRIYLYPMQKFSIALLLLCGMLVSACVDNNAPKGRYEKISTAYCECTARLAEINQKARSAEPGKLNDYFQQMESEFGKAKECAATIIGQFGHLNAAELDSVNFLLKTKCPDLADKQEQLRELLGE